MRVRWPRWILAAAAVVIVLSLAAICRLRPDTSLEALFAQNDPAANAMVRVFNGYRTVEELLVLATVPDAKPDPRRLEVFAANFQKAVAADRTGSRLSAGVIWRTDAQTEKFFEQVVVPGALFYLDDPAFAAAKERLSRAEIFQQIHHDRAMLAAPGPAAQELAKIILIDPLHLHEFIMNSLTRLRPFKTFQNSNAFLSPDGRSILIRVRGRRPVSDLQFSRDFTAAIMRIARQTDHDHLQLDFTGSYAIAAASQQAIRSDMISSVVGSVVFLQLLFLLAYRRPIGSFLLAMAPIAVGILLGFGAYALLKPTFTPVGAAIGGILAGMGIDYSIQFLSRYQFARAENADSAQAAVRTLRTLWPAMLAAWATSLIGFAAIGSANVRALRDFSLLGSLGLTGAFAAALTLLPALLAIFSRRNQRHLGILRSGFANLTRIHRFANHKHLLAIIGTVLFLTAAIILCVPGKWISLDPDLSALNPQPNPALDAERTIQDRMGTSPQGMICYLHANSQVGLVHLAHEAGNRLRDTPGVSATFGLDSLLPDPIIAQRRLGELDPKFADQVVADLRAALNANGFKFAAFAPYADFLHKLITNRNPPDLAALLQYPSLAETILPVDDFRSGHSRHNEAVTYVFAKNTAADPSTGDTTTESIRIALSGLPGATLTGLGVLSHDAEANVARQLPKLIAIAMAVIAAYLLIHFRSFSDLILSLLPTIFSLTCVLAVGRLAGIRLNIINLVAFPLLIGIDVDYGVFLISAARKKRRRIMEPDELLASIAPSFSAVILCAAATILGFASLLFTSIPAVHSLGLLVSVGILSCAAAIGLLILPSLFMGW